MRKNVVRKNLLWHLMFTVHEAKISKKISKFAIANLHYLYLHLGMSMNMEYRFFFDQ